MSSFQGVGTEGFHCLWGGGGKGWSLIHKLFICEVLSILFLIRGYPHFMG